MSAETVINLILLAVAAFVQNMAFTWVSRSRNSGDPSYHRWAALTSNGVWFVTQIFLLGAMLPAFMAREWWVVGLVAIVYCIATTEGSVLMMRILLKKESGKQRVGAR